MDKAIEERLSKAGMNKDMPGYSTTENAKLLPPVPKSGALFSDTVPAALRKLMKSYYDYGRSNWKWISSAASAARDGGLVKGATAAVACGDFNNNFKWLAENGLGITGITLAPGSSVPLREATTRFLTKPGGAGIDSKWPGNVRTAKLGFADLKCFRFSEHYWLIHDGMNYDVCFNNTFASAADIVLTTLDVAEENLTGMGGADVWKLEKPHKEGDHLVMIEKPGPNNAWASWQIATKDQVPKLGLK